jgi:hypothetical protein
MTEIKQKNSENGSRGSSIFKTFVITVAVLFVPTICMFFSIILYGFARPFPPHPYEADLLSHAEKIANWLPLAGFFGAIVSSWFVVSVLKMRDKLSAALLAVVMTGSVLFVIYTAGTSLTEAASQAYSYGDMPSYLIRERVTVPVLEAIFIFKVIVVNVLTFIGLKLYAKYRN